MLHFARRLATTTANVAPKSKLTWNEYFQLRLKRNRARPLLGVPFFIGGTAAVVGYVEFAPMEPIMGIDSSFMMIAGSVMAGLASYQVGAGLGQVAWRVVNGRISRSMDRMDKAFYARIKNFRAERGQSPYIDTMSGTGNLVRSMFGKKADAATARQDFYGEKIRSVQDYRTWLRRQRALTKEQLGPAAPPIRGVSS